MGDLSFLHRAYCLDKSHRAERLAGEGYSEGAGQAQVGGGSPRFVKLRGHYMPTLTRASTDSQARG